MALGRVWRLFLAVRAPEPDPLLPRLPRLVPPDDRPAASAGSSRPPVHPALTPGLASPVVTCPARSLPKTGQVPLMPLRHLFS
jgi:hypothetical protein